MALSTCTIARWTILSSSDAMPRPPLRPIRLGDATRREAVPVGPVLHPTPAVPGDSLPGSPGFGPRHTIDTGGRVALQLRIRMPQSLDGDVMQGR